MPFTPEHLSERITRSQRLAARFASALSPSEVAQAALTEVRESFGAVSATVYEVCGQRRTARLLGSFGLADDVVAWLRELPLATPMPLFEAIQSGRVCWHETHADLVAAYPHLNFTATSKALFQASICVPLLVGDRAIGGISLGLPAPRPLNEADAAVLVELAAHAALALDRCLGADASPNAERVGRSIAAAEREVARCVAAVAMARGVVSSVDQVRGAGAMQDATRNVSIAAGIIAEVTHALAAVLGDGTAGGSAIDAAPVLTVALEALAVATQQCAEAALGLTAAITEIADQGETNSPAVPEH